MDNILNCGTLSTAGRTSPLAADDDRSGNAPRICENGDVPEPSGATFGSAKQTDQFSGVVQGLQMLRHAQHFLGPLCRRRDDSGAGTTNKLSAEIVPRQRCLRISWHLVADLLDPAAVLQND